MNLSQCGIDLGQMITTIAAALTVIGFFYTFFRNFKIDINGHIDKIEIKIDKMDARIDTLEERMFWMATGKKLQDAILEEHMKIESKKTQ
jgi:hypothetical protein